MMSQEIDYLNPALPPGLRRVSMPVVDATPATLDGFGRLVEDPRECPIEIVQWPAVGSRPIDPGTGDEAGTTEGTFVSEWRGDILYGRNEAVGGHYILAYAREPEEARDDIAPEKFVCFRFDGTQGLYIHPDIWHEGVFALGGTQRFFDKQGAVHARVSVDFAREFGCLLEAQIASDAQPLGRGGDLQM